MLDTHTLRDSNKGYRHPFLFGINYLGGVGGQIYPQASGVLVNFSYRQITQEPYYAVYSYVHLLES